MSQENAAPLLIHPSEQGQKKAALGVLHVGNHFVRN